MEKLDWGDFDPNTHKECPILLKQVAEACEALGIQSKVCLKTRQVLLVDLKSPESDQVEALMEDHQDTHLSHPAHNQQSNSTCYRQVVRYQCSC